MPDEVKDAQKTKFAISVVFPTLNEAENVKQCLVSFENQTYKNFEVIVVDGGSTDGTAQIAKRHRVKVLVRKGCREFPSRNLGAKVANGSILVFTCADVIFPGNLLHTVEREFREDKDLVAITGPDIPFDSSLAKMEYAGYNLIRWILSSLPIPLKKFSTSTNLLAVRKNHFIKTGGFISDINADGLMGRKLSGIGKVKFSLDTKVFISTRRFKKMGFFKFNLHYIYVLENFLPFLSNTDFLRRFKQKSGGVHRQLHENPE